MTLDQKILELVKKYMGKLVQKKVLTSMEEVEANTNETNLVAAQVVAELNNKLGNCALEQDGEDFFIVGADSVRKKLGSPDIKEIHIGLNDSCPFSYVAEKEKKVIWIMGWAAMSGVKITAFMKHNGNMLYSITNATNGGAYHRGVLTMKPGDTLKVSDVHTSSGGSAYVGVWSVG